MPLLFVLLSNKLIEGHMLARNKEQSSASGPEYHTA